MTSWQRELAEGIQDVTELLEAVGVSRQDVSELVDFRPSFPLRVPRQFVEKIERGNPKDPLLLQVLPLRIETLNVEGYCDDPLHEAESTKIPGLIHRFTGRVLVIAAGQCGINCRFCFRREFPYVANTIGRQTLNKLVDYLHSDTTIEEVILSGGDPLMMSDSHLGNVIENIGTVNHIKRLRIHTRLPVVIPGRITQTLLEVLRRKPRLRITMVLHCNHAQELNSKFSEAVQCLLDQRITVFSQSVLLRGINDSVVALSKLFRSLYDSYVIPYYLHTLDRTSGTAHWEVPLSEAREIYRQLLAQLPGYMVPRFVMDGPGLQHKMPICVMHKLD